VNSLSVRRRWGSKGRRKWIEKESVLPGKKNIGSQRSRRPRPKKGLNLAEGKRVVCARKGEKGKKNHYTRDRVKKRRGRSGPVSERRGSATRKKKERGKKKEARIRQSQSVVALEGENIRAKGGGVRG